MVIRTPSSVGKTKCTRVVQALDDKTEQLNEKTEKSDSEIKPLRKELATAIKNIDDQNQALKDKTAELKEKTKYNWKYKKLEKFLKVVCFQKMSLRLIMIMKKTMRTFQ